MLSTIRSIIVHAENQTLGSIFCGVVLAIFVTLENFKRVLFRKIMRFGEIQSKVIMGIIYFIATPVTIFLYLLSGKWRTEKKDLVYPGESFSSLKNNHQKMY